MKHKVLLKSSVLFIATAFAAPALASGYHFGTQSVSAQSTANSSAAEAADPSTIFYNPAGLTRLEGTQATVNANIVLPNVKYQNIRMQRLIIPARRAHSSQSRGRLPAGLTPD